MERSEFFRKGTVVVFKRRSAARLTELRAVESTCPAPSEPPAPSGAAPEPVNIDKRPPRRSPVELPEAGLRMPFDGGEMAVSFLAGQASTGEGDSAGAESPFVAVGVLEVRLAELSVVARQVELRSAMTAEALAFDEFGRMDDAASPRDLLMLSYAARFHWARVPDELELARADWLLTHAHLRAGHKDLASQHAQLCHAAMQKLDAAPYDQATGLAAMARTLAARADGEEALRYLTAARRLAERIQSVEERTSFEEDLAAGEWYGLR